MTSEAPFFCSSFRTSSSASASNDTHTKSLRSHATLESTNKLIGISECLTTSTNRKECHFSEHSNRFSFHDDFGKTLNYGDFKQFVSCPCVNLSSKHIDLQLAPTPPKRRAESFLCVIHHIHKRAKIAQQSYDKLFSFLQHQQQIMSDQDPNDSISRCTGISESFEPIIQKEDVSNNNHDINSSPPKYTPPPPLDSVENNSPYDLIGSSSTTERRVSPMFIYSYDPPTPEKLSEYDPPQPPQKNYHPLDCREMNNYLSELSTNSNNLVTDKTEAQPTDGGTISPTSNISSSTLSATLLLTQDSDMSPLPLHANRVSPMNTETLTPSSPLNQLLTVGSSATYTCTSPAFSIYSDVIHPSSDLSVITMTSFSSFNVEPISPKVNSSQDTLDDLERQTPDTICVSPLISERNSHSHSKTSEEPSQVTQSVSDSQKKSQEEASVPTNTSSDQARRSSPQSSPDLSLSSLPSDTITMNAGIESIGTDSDPNDSSTWSTGNVNRDNESLRSRDDTDQTNDSAFGSPSLSPTFTRSCTVTPIPIGRPDIYLPSTNVIQAATTSGQIPTSSFSLHDIAAQENGFDSYNLQDNRIEAYSTVDSVDENTESESIYPESECDIRLMSRADTDIIDSSHKESSPERHTTPIIAELCDLENRRNESLQNSFHEPSNRNLNEISSSGNSSMSNSPALSNDQLNKKATHNQSVLQQVNEHNRDSSHLSKWLDDNQRSYKSVTDYDSASNDNSQHDQCEIKLSKENEIVNNGVIIEELSSEPTIHSNGNGGRTFSYFGPLPTIHEVVDTPTDQTPSNEIPDCPAAEISPKSLNHPSSYSPIISSLLHSDSAQYVSTTGPSPRSMNTLASPLPPAPPPRIRVSPLRTPPLPPPPTDDESVNLYPLPPLPSDEACLPPLPPPPSSFCLSESPPPVPPHAPSPPQRMYLLIPLAPCLRKSSPPPAPMRSTSLRRSPPPPPPPRSAVQTPSAEYITFNNNTNGDGMLNRILGDDSSDDENRSPSSTSDVGSVICVSKLTPVPEEKSNHNSPLPPALLVATPENSMIKSRNSRSPLTREDLINNNENEINNASPSNFKIFSKIDINTHESLSPSLRLPCSFSPQILSPSPPPPPPRGKICITPPLPPPPSPKVYFSAENANIEKTVNLSQHKSNIMEEVNIGKKLHADTSEEIHTLHDGVIDQSPVEPTTVQAPPPPPPPKTAPPPPPKVPRSLSNTSTPGSVSAPASPLVSVSNYGKLVIDRSDLTLLSADEEVGRVFSSGLRWGWLSDNVDTIAMYTQLRPIIQHGPQCGLVALSMASQLSGGSGSSTRRPSIVTTPSTPTGPSPASTVSPADLLEAARVCGYTTHGEMFSAESLATLANQTLGENIEACVRRDVLTDKHLFLEMMLAGALLLVPYDSEHNHQPGKYKGHKAHWGVVSGAIVQSRNFAHGISSAASIARPDSRIDWLWHVRRGYHSTSRSTSRPSSRGPSRIGPGGEVARIVGEFKRDRSASPATRQGDVDRVVRSRSMTPNRGGCGSSINHSALNAFKQVSTDDMSVIVLWRQGKSRLLVSSTLEELSSSNAQLREYPRAEAESGFEADFIVGNVEEGLAGQVVVINRTTQPLTALSELLERLQS